MLSMTLWLLTVLVPLQIFLGDQHGLNTLAASAGQARRDRGALGHQRSVPLTLFAIPDQASETQSLRDRGALSRQPHPDPFSLDGEIKGLKDFPAEDRPPVAIRLLRLPHHGRHWLS